MASSGSFSGSILSGHYKIQVDWTQEADVTANTSLITCTISLVNDWYLFVPARYNNSITIDGITQRFTSPAYEGTGKITLATVTQKVNHETDGSKVLDISVAYELNAYINQVYYAMMKAEAAIVLDTIPRASLATVPDTEMGTAATIRIASASADFRHTITVAFGTVTGTIITKTALASLSWTPPLYLAGEIPNAITGTCTITCITYLNDVEIGMRSSTVVLRVPSSIKPSMERLSVTRMDGEVPTGWGIYVQGKSAAKADIINAQGSYGSTVKSYSISGGTFFASARSLTTGVLTSSGSFLFTAYVTDSRGRNSDPVQAEIQVVPYVPPVISGYYTYRCDSYGNYTNDGTYVKGIIVFSFSSCEEKNAVSTAVYYKLAASEDWVDAQAFFESNVSVIFGNGQIVQESTFHVKYEITDAFHTVELTDIVPTSAVVMDFMRGGLGVAFGKVSEQDHLLEVAESWDIKTKGKLLKNYIADTVYPVGSFYFSLNPTNPSSLFGGTWVAVAGGRTLISVGTGVDDNGTERTFSNGQTGGEFTHALTVAEMPGHNHGGRTSSGTTDGGNMRVLDTAGGNSTLNHMTGYEYGSYRDISDNSFPGALHYHTISSQGGWQYHNNMQPFLACYIWRRTA